jgi:hypothetical protein
VPVNGVFFELAKFHQKREIQNSKKRTGFEEGFQSPEVRKKKNEKSPDLCIWFSFCGQKKVKG